MVRKKKKAARKKAVSKKAVKKAPRKKIVKKKAAKSKSVARSKAAKAAKTAGLGTVIGAVTHYFPKVMAAVVKLKAPLATGDTVRIKGHTTDITQAITSMQIDHVVVNQAKKGAEIGLLVSSRVRQHDVVYKP